MRKLILPAAALAAALPGVGLAAHLDYYAATLNDLRNTGMRPTGFARLTHDTTLDTLLVQIDAINVAAGRVHAQHIHGPRGGDAISPPQVVADDDGDGLIELGEGADFYGPIILPLDPFPTAPGGTIDFEMTYDLSDSSIFASGFSRADLFPLTNREIVVHGGFPMPLAGLDPNAVLEPNDLDSAGYSILLPILSGSIERFDFTQLPNNGEPDFATPVPLPAAGWALVAGVGALFGYGRFSRRAG